MDTWTHLGKEKDRIELVALICLDMKCGRKGLFVRKKRNESRNLISYSWD